MKETIPSYEIKRIILEESKRANVGHIGSALSIADIIAFLFGDFLHIPDSKDSTRDRFILSKGHAALALYAALYLKGILTEAELHSYCSNGGLMGIHPDHSLTGIDFTTGSLGHGITYGIGVALGAKIKKVDYKTVVLISDAECNEGSTWEAVMFAAHHRLSNLIVIIDNNSFQALGKTKHIINLDSLSEKWNAFKWIVYEVNGHDKKELKSVFEKINTRDGYPTVVIANTVLGKGVSFMEENFKWHYWPMSDEDYHQALLDITQEINEKSIH